MGSLQYRPEDDRGVSDCNSHGDWYTRSGLPRSGLVQHHVQLHLRPYSVIPADGPRPYSMIPADRPRPWSIMAVPPNGHGAKPASAHRSVSTPGLALPHAAATPTHAPQLRRIPATPPRPSCLPEPTLPMVPWTTRSPGHLSTPTSPWIFKYERQPNTTPLNVGAASPWFPARARLRSYPTGAATRPASELPRPTVQGNSTRLHGDSSCLPVRLDLPARKLVYPGRATRPTWPAARFPTVDILTPFVTVRTYSRASPSLHLPTLLPSRSRLLQ